MKFFSKSFFSKLPEKVQICERKIDR